MSLTLDADQVRQGQHCAPGFQSVVWLALTQSGEMLTKATDRRVFDALDQADITNWTPSAPPALIFSNAALHWLADHEALIPQLFASLSPGGVLAIQMPAQLLRPSHQSMINAAASVRPDLFSGWTPFPGPLEPAAYARLTPEAEVDIWTTEYHQRLAASPDGAHPVRSFSSATAGMPILSRLSETEEEAFNIAWDAGLDLAYPRLPDGGVWFPFRRLFIVARKAACA